MSHFVSRVSGSSSADFQALHHQLLSRDPVEGPSKEALESGALNEEDERYLLGDDDAGLDRRSSQASGSTPRARAKDAGEPSTRRINTPASSKRASRRQLSDDGYQAHSDQTNTVRQDLTPRPSPSRAASSSSLFTSRRNSPEQTSPVSRRPPSRVDPTNDDLEASPARGRANGQNALNGKQQQIRPSASSSTSHPNPNRNEEGAGATKGVTFNEDIFTGESAGRPPERYWGQGKVTRSNSGFATLEEQLGGGAGMTPSSSQSQYRQRTPGMISPSEVAPRKLGTWDGVFMPVSLNVSEQTK